jgi:hypothetical protein
LIPSRAIRCVFAARSTAPIAAPVKQTLQVPGVGSLRVARDWSLDQMARRSPIRPIMYKAL